MSEPGSIESKTIRLVFELVRADNPRLYDDLVRFNKGTKRVNRLRTLAQEGLVAEQLPLGFGTIKTEADIDLGADSRISQVFEQPLTE